LETYRWIGEGLTAGLRKLGAAAEMVPIIRGGEPSAPPAFCFARTGSYEIEVAGKKLVGSAQRRQAGAFLQHGSILLGADRVRLRQLFPREGDPLAGMATLENALGHRPAFDEVVLALSAGFREAHGIELTPGGLTEAEETLMRRLIREKYATDAWTARGQALTDLSFVAPAR
jgi:lipoate-protein ligase A